MEEFVDIRIEDVAFDGENYWFFSREINALFSMNVSGQVIYRGMVPWEKVMQERLYSSVAVIGNKVYLIPFCASKIAVYEIKDNSFSKVEIPNKSNMLPRYMATFLHKTHLYIFGCRNLHVLVLDTDTDTVKVIEPREEYNAMNTSDVYFYKHPAYYDDSLWLYMCNSDKIMRFDIEQETISFIELYLNTNGYIGTYYDGDSLWGVSRSLPSEVIQYNIKANDVNRIPITTAKEIPIFVGLVVLGKELHLFIEGDTDCSIKWDGIFWHKNAIFAKVIDNNLIYYDEKEKCLVINNQRFALKVSKSIIMKKYYDLIAEETIKENEFIRLVDFLCIM